jgi:hypothetical protein
MKFESKMIVKQEVERKMSQYFNIVNDRADKKFRHCPLKLFNPPITPHPKSATVDSHLHINIMLSQNLKDAAEKAASAAQNIIPQTGRVSRSVSNSWTSNLPRAFSTSPTLAFHSPPGIGAPLSRTKTLKPFATQDIKVLLLENVNKTGQDLLKEQGYQVEILKSSLGEDELIEKIK